MARIAFLSLGAMGSRMAANLLAAGHELTVWNRDPAKAEALVMSGAVIAETPREAAEGAEFVISMLRDDDASRAVWCDTGKGALAGMGRGAIAIECSTLSPGWVQALATHCAAANIAFVDAPLAGSRPQADAKALIFFAGGETDDVNRVAPILLDMGSMVHHAGNTGAGMVVKLGVNTLFAVQVAAMAELTEIFAKQGLDVAKAVEIVGSTPVCAPGAKAAADMMLKDAFAPMFPVELVAKDLGYAVSAAASPEFAALTLAAKSIYERAIAAGYGGDHLTGVVKLYR